MKIDRESLPKTLDACHALIAELVGELDVKERKIRRIQHQLEQLLRWRYGPKRERVDENQLFLFAAGLVATDRDIPPSEKPSPKKRKRKLRKNGLVESSDVRRVQRMIGR